MAAEIDDIEASIDEKDLEPIEIRRHRVSRAFGQCSRWCYDRELGDPEPLPATSPGLARALWGKAGRPRDVWARFQAAELWTKRARKVGVECGTSWEQVPNFHCLGCGHVWNTVPMGCSLRYCPECVRHYRARAIKKVTRIIESFARPRFATLTLESMHDLQAMLELVVDSWQHLRRRNSWAKFVDGAVWCLEVTWNRDAGWHAHLHIVWDGRYIPRPELAQAWLEATAGRGQRVWLQRCNGNAKKAARELSKYVGKDMGWGKGFAAEPDRLAEFLACMWSFRALRTYGTARKAVDPDDAELVCPACGAPEPLFIGTCRVAEIQEYQNRYLAGRVDRFAMWESPP